MEHILRTVIPYFKKLFTNPLVWYNTFIFILAFLAQRNYEILLSDMKPKYVSMPTKLFMWPIRLAMGFMIIAPILPDLPSSLVGTNWHAFPVILPIEMTSFALLGMQVNQFCEKRPYLCYLYYDEQLINNKGRLMSFIIQLSLTMHVFYVMWLIKSLRYVIMLAARPENNEIIPYLISVCRVVLLIISFNLRGNPATAMVFLACKIIFEYGLSHQASTSLIVIKRIPVQDYDESDDSDDQMSDSKEVVLRPIEAMP